MEVAEIIKEYKQEQKEREERRREKIEYNKELIFVGLVPWVAPFIVITIGVILYSCGVW